MAGRPWKPLLVGELNPYGGDDRTALFPLPLGCTGHRLCNTILDLSPAHYLRAYDRTNLCRGQWSLKQARIRAGEILSVPPPVIVLLGSKSCSAFDLPFLPFTTWEEKTLGFGVIAFVALPHPSGRNLLWNAPGAFQRARTLLYSRGCEVGVNLPQPTP